jgi:hypothetical protein
MAWCFMTEHHGGQQEDTHREVRANQLAVAKDQPKQRKRGTYRGKKKLLDLEYEANKNWGANLQHTHQSNWNLPFKSKADNLLERSSNVKVGTMMATFDRPGKQANVCQRKRDEDMPPRLLQYYFPYLPVWGGGRTMNVMSKLERELITRTITFEPTLKVTKECDILKKDKVRRLEEQVQSSVQLDSPRIPIPWLEAPSKTSAPETRNTRERRKHKW